MKLKKKLAYEHVTILVPEIIANDPSEDGKIVVEMFAHIYLAGFEKARNMIAHDLIRRVGDGTGFTWGMTRLDFVEQIGEEEVTDGSK